jgi:serpin B
MLLSAGGPSATSVRPPRSPGAGPVLPSRPMQLTTRALLLFCLAALGCRSNSSPSGSTPTGPPSGNTSASAPSNTPDAPAPSTSAPSLPPPLPATPPAPVDPAALTSAASGMRDLAVDLYRRLAKTKPGNFAFSPASISSAFALTWPGAHGETAAELGRVLHFNGAPTNVLAAHGALLGHGAPGCELATGNSAWLQNGLTLAPAYAQALRQAANMELIPADFQAQPQQEVERINAWVAQRTQDRIKDLLSSNALDTFTRLVLANAVYFKGTWKDPFEKQATRDKPFRLLNGKTVSTPRMHRTGRYRYFSNESLQVLEMPYACGDIAMVVLLPGGEPPAKALRRVEDALTSPQLQSWLDRLSSQEVGVSLPRFELEERLPLRPELEALGVRLAFSDNADFRGITPDAEIKIGEAFHKSWMKVDEEGTEAAAATAVAMLSMGAPLIHPFVVDRPFLFLIRNTKTGAILFMGRVADPR